MTREQLRQKLLDGADKIRNSAVWRFMNAEQRQLSSTGRVFWAADNAVTNAAIDAFLGLLNTTRSAAPDPITIPGFFTTWGVVIGLFLDSCWQRLTGLFGGKEP